MRPSVPKVFVLFCGCWNVFANPLDPLIVSGEAAFQNLGASNLQIIAGDRAIIHWDSFSIQPGELTQFLQPSSSASVLNRVVGSNPSALLGQIQANGKVYLINPSGILVGEDAIINTGSFIASTLDVLDQDFLGVGDLCFQGDSKAKIINYGQISAWDGNIALLGYQVENEGSLFAPNGTASIAAGTDLLLQPHGGVAVRLHAEERSDEAGIVNDGLIQAIRTELAADGNAYSYAIRHTGVIDALGVEEIGGEIYLVAEKGVVEASGSMIARNGGEIRVLGEQVGLLDGADLNASGPDRGGTILVGGDFRGKNPEILNARHTWVGEGVSIRADAIENGPGGKVILWSDDTNFFQGSIWARGGALGGDGGFIEVSGKNRLYPLGRVDTRASNGKFGTVYWDPAAISIVSGAAGSSTNESPTFPIVACGSPSGTQTYTSTMNTATFADADLNLALSCANVVIDADGGGSALSGSITVESGAQIQWSALTTLTLLATGASDTIIVNGSITNPAFPVAGTTVIAINSPTVKLGDGTQTTTPSINLNNGNLSINASSSFSMLTGSSINPGQIIGQNGETNISITAGAINLTGTSSFVPEIALANGANGAISLQSTSGDIDLSHASVGGAGFPMSIDITSAGNCTLLDTSIASAFAAGIQISASLGNYTQTGTTVQTVTDPISILAGSSLIIESDSVNSAVVSTTGASITLQGGSVALQGAASNSNNLSIGTSGPIQITATTGNITLDSTQLGAANTFSIDANGGDLTMSAQGDIITNAIYTAGGLPNLTISAQAGLAQSAISISAVGTLQLQGTIQNTSPSWTTQNAISLSGATVTLGATSLAQQSPTALSCSSGVLSISAPTQFNMCSGNATGAAAGCTISGSGNFNLTGGGFFCQAGNTLGATHGANLLIDNTGNVNLDLTGDFHVITSDQGYFSMVPSGAITFSSVNNMILDASQTTIGATAINMQAASAMSISRKGNITITGGTGAGSYIFFGSGGGNLSITSPSGFAPGNIQIQSDEAFVLLGSVASTTIEANDISLTSGGASGPAMIASAYAGGTGDLTITANTISIQGSSSAASPYCSAGLQVGKSALDTKFGIPGSGGNGNLTIQAAGAISLNAGSGVGADAHIATFGTAATNNITITQGGSLSLASTVNAPAAISTGFTGAGAGAGGVISIDVIGNTTMTGAAPAQIIMSVNSAGLLSLSTTGSYNLTDSLIQNLGSGGVQIIAGKSFAMDALSTVSAAGAGSLTLVVDNAPPYNTPPNVDSGTFQSAGTISTGGGPLWIFSSIPGNTTISGLLNGTAYSYPTNTITPQWFSTFAGGGGSPFTVFFKASSLPVPPLPPLPVIFASSSYVKNYTSAIANASQNWDIFFSYDTFSYIDFMVWYGEETSYSSNRITSYDLNEDVTYQSVKENYRNYDTLKLEQF